MLKALELTNITITLKFSLLKNFYRYFVFSYFITKKHDIKMLAKVLNQHKVKKVLVKSRVSF